MVRNVIIAVLAVAVAGAGAWGYQENKEKNAVLLHAENNYQRAFHDLSYQMDDLHEQIGTTLAMNSGKTLSPALADVWRITSEAKSQVGQLPLSLLPFNKTEEFLSDIGTFSYRTAVRNLDDDPLTKDETAKLKTLYTQSAEIRNELRKVQHLVLKDNLRWMDVELALASGKEKTDNTIIDGFKTVEKRVEGYEEQTNENPTVVDFQQRDENFSRLQGKKVTKEQAVAKAKKYSGITAPKNIAVTDSRKGAEYGFFNVVLSNSDGHEATMDVTKKGGYPIWYIDNREITEQHISLNEAVQRAGRYLEKHGYKKLELTESIQQENTALLTYVTSEDGVRIYPDSIKMKVALDNGDIVGFSAADYLKSSRERKISNPKLTLQQARGYLNPSLDIHENRLAVIVNELGKEVLCYEFLGTMNQHDTYRAYINAENGTEEKVEKLRSTDPGYNDMM